MAYAPQPAGIKAKTDPTTILPFGGAFENSKRCVAETAVKDDAFGAVTWLELDRSKARHNYYAANSITAVLYSSALGSSTKRQTPFIESSVHNT